MTLGPRFLRMSRIHKLIKTILFFPFKVFRLGLRILFSRLFILLFMISLFIASHTVSFVADLTTKALATATDYVAPNRANLKSSAALQAENRDLKQRAETQRQAANRNLRRMRQRIRTTTLANVAAVGGEALPYFGIGIIVGATAYEVKEACATMSDIYELQLALDPEEAQPDDRDAVCGLQVPTREELWEGIKNTPGAAWDTAVASARGTADWAGNLERPDFGGAWQSLVAGVASWFE